MTQDVEVEVANTREMGDKGLVILIVGGTIEKTIAVVREDIVGILWWGVVVVVFRGAGDQNGLA